jgi:uncharacterized protein (TIGR02996 family)
MRNVFLRDIIDDPDDLATRRAFADWLLEQPAIEDQEQGEFIALLLELATGHVLGARRRQLEQRERELLGRYRAEWERPLRQTGLVARCVFRRGLVAGIKLPVNASLLDGRKLEEILTLAPITELICPSFDEEHALALSDCRTLSRVASITARPTAETLRFLLSSCGVDGLRELILDHSASGDHLLQILANWPGLGLLVRLRLQSAGVTPAGVSALLRSPFFDDNWGGRGQPPRLKTLDLRNNRGFTSIHARRLIQDSRFPPSKEAWIEAMLSGVLGRVERRTALNVWGADALVGELASSSARKRFLALGRLAEVDPNPEALPNLVRRAFEPDLRDRARQELKRYRFFEASATLAPWLENWADDAAVWLDSALANHALPLPLKVQEAFAELCQRRLLWRARHGRAAPAPLVPGDAGDDREKLRAVVALVADRAADDALRHTPPECSEEKRAAIRRKAKAKECAWLASWLVRLLQ